MAEGFTTAEMDKLRSLACDLSLPCSTDQQLLESLAESDHFQHHAEAVLNPSRLFGNTAPEPEPEPEPKTIFGMRPAIFGMVVFAVIVICGLVIVIAKRKRAK